MVAANPAQWENCALERLSEIESVSDPGEGLEFIG
jgi:hypothetical protein